MTASLFWLALGMYSSDAKSIALIPTSCSDGNYTQVRTVAFDGLLLGKWYAPKILKYLFAVMMHDPSPIIRRHVARGMCESLSVLYAVGEIKSISKDGETVLIEEDGGAPEKTLEARKNDPESFQKSLRKDKEIGKNESLRESIMPLLLLVLYLILDLPDLLAGLRI
jgi:transcription initiation factor TFIID subunit 2